MENKFWKVIGYWAMGLVLFVATLIIIRWAVHFATWSSLSASDTGTWAGAIGTVATLAMTIRLATSERKERLHREQNLALVTVAGLEFKIPAVKLMLEAALTTIIMDAGANRPTDYAKLVRMLDQIPLWQPEDLAPLAAIEGHLAARLAFASAEITGVRTGIEMATKQRIYTQAKISSAFNLTLMTRLQSPIETLEDSRSRCRKYMNDSGFGGQSPTD